MALKYDPAFYAALDKFVELVNARYKIYWERMGYNHGLPPEVAVEGGNKYIKLVVADVSKEGIRHSRSVFGFVNSENGDVLKAASWKAPAKHARGNILNPDGGAGALSPEGAMPSVNYLK